MAVISMPARLSLLPVAVQGSAGRIRINGRAMVAELAASPLPVLPPAWQAFALPASYICPMCAQLALARGEAATFSAGALLIGGRALMGRAGKVFAFASAATAARWVDINKDRAALELAAREKLTPAEVAAWQASRAAVLQEYAAQVLNRAAKEGDATKRAALIAEVDFARIKWA